jgi:citronellol/citronellal dehydrogenase
MASLNNKTLFITGASRGIGLAIALRAAQDGANIAVIAKTADPHPRLPGTIYTAAESIEKAGGRALPIATDIRFEEQVAGAVEQTVRRFGGIDILVNNASAIQLSNTKQTELKRFDLMFHVNVRGTFLGSRLCLPHLQKSDHAHVLTMAPPISLEAKWFAGHAVYTVSKFGMAMMTFGIAAEFSECRIAFNCLWQCRTPEIVADAAYAILTKEPTQLCGQFCIDEEILKAQGTTNFDKYAVNPEIEPIPDLFVD